MVDVRAAGSTVFGQEVRRSAPLGHRGLFLGRLVLRGRARHPLGHRRKRTVRAAESCDDVSQRLWVTLRFDDETIDFVGDLADGDDEPAPEEVAVWLSVLASKATAQTPPQPRAAERGVSVEIHIFLGDARAKPDNLSYPPGQKHALLIMLKQPRATAPEWRRAEALAATKGWYDVKLSKASTVDERTLAGQPAEVVESYRQALEQGAALIIFSDPIQ